MAMDFNILRGNKHNLVDEHGNSKLPPEKLVNGYWYLTNDTAEVYVALEIDGVLQLKKINECDINNDFASLESFEDRLEALEAEHTHVCNHRSEFPDPSKGQRNHIYVALDENKTYIFADGKYIHIADRFDYTDHDKNPETPDVRIIFGGTADN